MQLNPYLVFNGQCREAFALYEKTLGGKIEMMQTHADTPMGQQAPPDWQDKIMHAQLAVGEEVIMGSDRPPQDYHKPEGFSVSLSLEDPAAADRIFNAFADGGTIQMPIQETFWATRFGMLTDKFGIPWIINCSKPA